MTAVEAVRTDRVRSRERILDSATDLFWRQGFSRTSVAQVAEGAEVSKSLIFWHFQNKDTLFRAALEDGVDALALDVRGDLQGLSAIEQLNWLIDEYCTFVSTHLRSVKFLLGLVMGLEQCPEGIVQRVTQAQLSYRNLMAAVLEAARGKGLVSVHVQPVPHASLIMAALYGILLRSLVDREASECTNALLRQLKVRLVEPLRSERQEGTGVRAAVSEA